MKKQNLLRHLLMTALLVGGIFLTGVENNAHAILTVVGGRSEREAPAQSTAESNALNSGSLYTGSASGGSAGSGTIVGQTDTQSLYFEEILDSILGLFS